MGLLAKITKFFRPQGDEAARVPDPELTALTEQLAASRGDNITTNAGEGADRTLADLRKLADTHGAANNRFMAKGS